MKSYQREKILFIQPSNASFVLQDKHALSERYAVRSFLFGRQKGLGMVWRQLRLWGWLLVQIWGAKRIFIWFADYHALLPCLMGRIWGVKTVIVIGGYDAVRAPAHGYGALNKRLRRKVVAWSCKLAHLLLPVSRYTEGHLLQNLGMGLKRKSEVIHNGIDLGIFEAREGIVRARRVICVAAAEDLRTVNVKGLDRVKAAAAVLPDVHFQIIGVKGVATEALSEGGLKNLELLPFVPREQLGDYYAGAQVVCLLSRFESFGLALAEGMLYGCVPVTMAGIGAAEILEGGPGVVVTSGEGEAIAAGIEEALARPADGVAAQEWIKGHFLLEHRAEKLYKVLETM